MYEVDDIARRARIVEELGFDYLACGEHLFFHGPTPNSLIALAAAAGATRSIRLLSSIALAPVYPAPLFAKLVSTLDRACNGRLELGLGAGGEFAAEFDAVGVDPATRFQRLDESLLVMRQLFTGEPTTFEGQFTRLNGQALNPPPVQRPGPPVWLAGRRRAGMARAGRFADVWMPYMLTPEAFQEGMGGVQRSAEDAGRSRDDVTGAIFLWACVDEDRAWASDTGVATVSAAYKQDFAPLADRYLLIGTPDEAARRLAEYAAAGATRAIISIAADPADHARVMQTLAKSVLPELKARV